MNPTLDCGVCKLRPFRLTDKESIVRHANNFEVWRNVRDLFPHPYTEADADAFLSTAVTGNSPDSLYAIDVNGEAIGSIGIHPRRDVERFSAEIGYWLGEAFWGRGIATAAVRCLSQYALQQMGLYRLFANVFASNPASMRVLEKAGYEREGVLVRSIVKDGILMDSVLYAMTRDPGLNYISHLL